MNPIIQAVLDKIFHALNIEVQYSRKRLELIQVVDRKNFKVCEPKEIRKGRIREHAFVVHVKKNGHITYEEMK